MQIMLLRMKTTVLVFYVTFHHTLVSKTKWRISKEELLPLHRSTRFNNIFVQVGVSCLAYRERACFRHREFVFEYDHRSLIYILPTIRLTCKPKIDCLYAAASTAAGSAAAVSPSAGASSPSAGAAAAGSGSGALIEE